MEANGSRWSGLLSAAFAVAVAVAGCSEHRPASQADIVESVASATASSAVPKASSTSEPRHAKRTSIVALAIGHAETCAVREDGRVACIGACNFCGRREWPDELSRYGFIEGVTDAVAIDGDDDAWCARRKDGTVACWYERNAARLVEGVMDAVDVSVPCALLRDGAIVCWEGGRAEKLAGIPPVRTLGHGKGAHCATTIDGAVYCWGHSPTTFLPDSPDTVIDASVRVAGIANADELDLSMLRGVCARIGDAVRCWGGEFRQPVHAIAHTHDVIEVSAADYHACVAMKDGHVACWGENATGQLGVDPTRLERSDDAIDVLGIRDVVHVAVGSGEPSGGSGGSCAITRTGEVWCWSGDHRWREEMDPP